MHLRALFLSIATPLVAVYAIDRWPGAVRVVVRMMRSAFEVVA